MNRSVRTFLWIAATLFLVALMSGWFVRKMTYPAPPFRVQKAPGKMQEIMLEDGSIAWYQAATPGNQVFLYFHGNAENLETLRLSGFFSRMQSLGVTMMAVDYPGYGRSKGSPSEESLIRCADAAIRKLAEMQAGKVFVCGWSLGAAVAIQTAARHPAQTKGLIALSAWSSLPEAAAEHFPQWLVKVLLRERYDSLQAAKNIHCAALLIHGEQDTLIPISQGKAVAEKLAGTMRWISLPATGHNDLLDNPRVWEEFKRFVN